MNSIKTILARSPEELDKTVNQYMLDQHHSWRIKVSHYSMCSTGEGVLRYSVLLLLTPTNRKK